MDTKRKKNNIHRGKWVEPGNRIMDLAWLRDGANTHTGEALLLAMLLHAKGKTKRGTDEVKHVARLLDDPNLED